MRLYSARLSDDSLPIFSNRPLKVLIEGNICKQRTSNLAKRRIVLIAGSGKSRLIDTLSRSPGYKV